MCNRIKLPGAGYELVLHDKDLNEKIYYIDKFLGEGNTCLVYKGHYFDNRQKLHSVIIKEFYPLYADKNSVLNIVRNNIENNEYSLIVNNNNESDFNRMKKLFIESNDLQAEFQEQERMVSEITFDIYDKIKDANGKTINNGTIYRISGYEGGFSYDQHKENDLSEILNNILQLAYIIEAYHKQNRLVLDIKPSNCIIVPINEKSNTMKLIDFGSVVKTDELNNAVLTGSNDWAPPELIDQNITKISIQTDFYMLGMVAFHRIFGQFPTSNMINNGVYSGFNFEQEIFNTINPDIVYELIDELISFFKQTITASPLRRFKNDNGLISVLNRISMLAYANSKEMAEILRMYGQSLDNYGVAETYLRFESQNLYDNFTSEGGKFAAMQKLKILDNKVKVIKRNDTIPIDPMTAFSHDNRIFLLGEGGMGKSTVLYEYWKNQKSHPTGKICMYIELNRYMNYRGESAENKGQETHFILEQIIKDIHNETTTPWDVLFNKANERREKLFDQLHGLKKLFEQGNSDNPKFAVLLDGLNEIGQENYQNAFLDELKRCAENWKNVQIIITGRKFPEEQDSADSTKNFTSYKFIGLDDKIKENELSQKYSSKDLTNIKANERLWGILSVPLFLNMYTGVKLDTEIKSRGKIMDAYIEKHEKSKRYHIETDVRKRTDASEFFMFLLKYLLPFVANCMEKEQIFEIRENYLMELFNKCADLYFINENNGVPYGYIEKRSSIHNAYKSLKNEGELREYIFRFLTDLSCYMIKNTSGKYEYIHQYFKDYFAAKYIYNIIHTSMVLEVNAKKEVEKKAERLRFIRENGLDYIWSDEVCELFGDLVKDYENAGNA